MAGIIDKIAQQFSMERKSLDLRSFRNRVIASNIANEETPYYKAKDFDFYKTLKEQKDLIAKGETSLELNRTNVRHIRGRVYRKDLVELLYRNPFQPSIDGNTVEMDVERANFTDNSLRYQTTVSFINQRIQGLTRAISGER